MKLSYCNRTQQFVYSELGTIIDTDASFESLLARHGMLEEEQLSEETQEDSDGDIWEEFFGK